MSYVASFGQVDQAAVKVEKKLGGATVEHKARISRIKWEGPDPWGL